jgi:hypothetical protein
MQIDYEDEEEDEDEMFVNLAGFCRSRPCL